MKITYTIEKLPGNGMTDLEIYMTDNNTGYDDSPGLYVKDEDFEAMIENEYGEEE